MLNVFGYYGDGAQLADLKSWIGNNLGESMWLLRVDISLITLK